ncbi:hypothetical protein [Scytonema sp. PCC 10023]|uniref:hypothetical protein n=1 Tax=Scytonema sp. PCC 10023 TaxID=1680591 RepID=UPI0039C6A03E
MLTRTGKFYSIAWAIAFIHPLKKYPAGNQAGEPHTTKEEIHLYQNTYFFLSQVSSEKANQKKYQVVTLGGRILSVSLRCSFLMHSDSKCQVFLRGNL